MEYTIKKLAKLAGVSTRTLRYYHEIGLLKPARKSTTGYRIYGQKEVDLLQQIMFYRELEVPLDEIRAIISASDFNGLDALKSHRESLISKRNRLEQVIENVENTIRAMKGDLVMSDSEKFEGFLKKMVKDNEESYGEEIREKYGEDELERANDRILKMSPEKYAALEGLTEELNETLRKAVEQGDPASRLAQRACELHKEWLSFHWDGYSKGAHMGLVQMYLEEPRFTAYYEGIAPGGAKFLWEAVRIYCS